jgi:hypothetical protein
MNNFKFQGYTFEPVRQLNANEKDDQHPQSATKNYSIQLPKVTAKPVLKDRESGWNYDKFYQAAQQAGAGEIDLFKVQGQGDTLYLPTTAYLSILPGAR